MPKNDDEAEPAVEVMPAGRVDPTTTAARSRAYKIRAAMRRGAGISDEDEAWLRDYEEAKVSNKSSFARGKSRVSFTEEHDETGAEGEAAKFAAIAEGNAAAPELARQEGRRLDYMMDMFLRQQQQTFVMLQSMTQTAFTRMSRLEESHAQFMDAQTAMLDSVREHYLARIEAEADAVLSKEPDPEPDALGEMAKGMLQQLAANQANGAAPAGAKVPA